MKYLMRFVVSLVVLFVALPARAQSYIPVVTPNGTTMPWTMKDGVKEFRLTADKLKKEFAPGMVVNAWGYIGQSP